MNFILFNGVRIDRRHEYESSLTAVRESETNGAARLIVGSLKAHRYTERKKESRISSKFLPSRTHSRVFTDSQCANYAEEIKLRESPPRDRLSFLISRLQRAHSRSPLDRTPSWGVSRSSFDRDIRRQFVYKVRRACSNSTGIKEREGDDRIRAREFFSLTARYALPR